jgi:hypothetical protein
MTDTDQLLADVLTAMVTCRHTFPAELVGRVLMAVGPSMLATAPAAEQAPYYTAYCQQPAGYDPITTRAEPWG